METAVFNSEPDFSRLQSTFSHSLLGWYRRSHRPLPWRATRDPYAILVSEVMLQQTQVKTVLPYYQRWMEKYPTLDTLAAASEADVLKSWEGLGYYRRVRLLHTAAKKIIIEYGGIFPKKAEEIANLPGVGPYTLGAVGSIAFGLPLPVLDGNVIRVLSRWFGIRENARNPTTRKQLWGMARSLIPPEAAGDFNQSMMELGATVCIPHNPLCLLCPVRDNCWAFRHGVQRELPVTTPQPPTLHQYEYAALLMRRGNVLLCQRKGGERMERLWQFPSVILKKPTRRWVEVWKETFGNFQKAERQADLTYSVTHHRVHLEFFTITGFTRKSVPDGKWVRRADIQQLAFTAAHRKLADQYLRK